MWFEEIFYEILPGLEHKDLAELWNILYPTSDLQWRIHLRTNNFCLPFKRELWAKWKKNNYSFSLFVETNAFKNDYQDMLLLNSA
jgi:hypothetical protein